VLVGISRLLRRPDLRRPRSSATAGHAALRASWREAPAGSQAPLRSSPWACRELETRSIRSLATGRRLATTGRVRSHVARGALPESPDACRARGGVPRCESRAPPPKASNPRAAVPTVGRLSELALELLEHLLHRGVVANRVDDAALVVGGRDNNRAIAQSSSLPRTPGPHSAFVHCRGDRSRASGA
jgi:hypothetical protein